jgi:hypothetical protein
MDKPGLAGDLRRAAGTLERATAMVKAANPQGLSLIKIHNQERIIALLNKAAAQLDRLSLATEFTCGNFTISSRGNGKWAVLDVPWVLNRNGEFEHEPLNSNRTDEFLERTRYTFEEAWQKLAGLTAKEKGKV